MSKLFRRPRCAKRVCSSAIQVHGRLRVRQRPIPSRSTTATRAVFQIYDGTNEVQKILISRELIAGH